MTAMMNMQDKIKNMRNSYISYSSSNNSSRNIKNSLSGNRRWDNRQKNCYRKKYMAYKSS